MPIYNEERFLAQALDGLLAQEYPHFELIISDNASEDATPQICAEYAARDPRIQYHRNETNLGSLRNAKQLFDQSCGDYFMWASGHDLREPSFLSRCVEVLETDPSVVLCYPQAVWTDAEGRALERVPGRIDTRGVADRISRLNVVLWGLVTGFPIYGLMRSSALRETRLCAPVVSPDIALLVELSLLGAFAYLPEPLLLARKPDDYGSWEVYIKKHFNRRVRGWAGQVLYWRMIGVMLQAAAKHTRSVPAKAVGMTSITVCMLMKYHWMLSGLLSLKRGPR